MRQTGRILAPAANSALLTCGPTVSLHPAQGSRTNRARTIRCCRARQGAPTFLHLPQEAGRPGDPGARALRIYRAWPRLSVARGPWYSRHRRRAASLVGHRAEIAQLVEHATENRGVASSILALGTTIWWSRSRAEVAQLVEHHLAKVRVAGSSPVFRSIFLSDTKWAVPQDPAAAPSSSGRTADFGSANRGSNPRGAATQHAESRSAPPVPAGKRPRRRTQVV